MLDPGRGCLRGLHFIEYEHTIMGLPWFLRLRDDHNLVSAWIEDHPHRRGLRAFGAKTKQGGEL
jgi:hypothetical protein